MCVKAGGLCAVGVCPEDKVAVTVRGEHSGWCRGKESGFLAGQKSQSNRPKSRNTLYLRACITIIHKKVVFTNVSEREFFKDYCVKYCFVFS